MCYRHHLSTTIGVERFFALSCIFRSKCNGKNETFVCLKCKTPLIKYLYYLLKTNAASSSTTLIHYQQLQAGTGSTTTTLQGSVTVPVSGLQVVTSQASSLAIHQQILLQSRQMRKCLIGDLFMNNFVCFTINDFLNWD